jgi:hypothetical protein
LNEEDEDEINKNEANGDAVFEQQAKRSTKEEDGLNVEEKKQNNEQLLRKQREIAKQKSRIRRVSCPAGSERFYANKNEAIQDKCLLERKESAFKAPLAASKISMIDASSFDVKKSPSSSMGLYNSQKAHRNINNGSIRAKKSCSLMNRIRRLSENSSISATNLNLTNGISKSSGLCISNSTIELSKNELLLNDPLLFRRHTNRRFKHGKTARILGIATLSFALTWSPYWYYSFYYSSSPFRSQPNFVSLYNATFVPMASLNIEMEKFFFKKIAKNSFFLNYILNPIFYSFVNASFRKSTINFFRKVIKFLTNHLCIWKKLTKLEDHFKRNSKQNLREDPIDLAKAESASLNNHTFFYNSKSFMVRVFSNIIKYPSLCCSKTNEELIK